MNFNSFSGLVGGTARNQIAAQTLAATTETAFVVNTDTSGTTATAIVGLPAGGGIAGSVTPVNPDSNAALLQQNSAFSIPRGIARPEFNSTSFDGRPFRIRLVGTGSIAGNSTSLTLRLYQGTSSSVVGTAGNRIAVTSAITTTAANPFNFQIESLVLWDSTTGSLQGTFNYTVNVAGTQTTGASAAISNNVAVTSVANMKFLATAQWGGVLGGTIQVKEFMIDRV